MKNRWLFLKRNIVEVVFAIIVVLTALATVFVIVMIFTPQVSDKSFPRLRESVTAVSTGAMVFATLLLAFVTYRIIKSDRQRENRDRKERLLNEIIEWASSVSRAAISRQTRDPHALWSTKLEYKYQKSKGKYMVQIINSSFPELTQIYLDIDTKINEAISFTEDVINRNASKSDLINYETKLTESVEKLLEEAAKIRTRA